MSATFCLMEFEDIFARADRTPIPLGMMIAWAMKSKFRMALSTRERDGERMRQWFGTNGFPGDFFTYIKLREVTEVHMGDDDLFSAHLDAVRSDAVVELVVTPSPARAARAMQRGVAVLMFGHPATTPPEFRPGRQIRQWAEIEEAVTRSRVQRTEAMAEANDG